MLRQSKEKGCRGHQLDEIKLKGEEIVKLVSDHFPPETCEGLIVYALAWACLSQLKDEKGLRIFSEVSSEMASRRLDQIRRENAPSGTAVTAAGRRVQES